MTTLAPPSKKSAAKAGRNHLERGLRRMKMDVCIVMFNCDYACMYGKKVK